MAQITAAGSKVYISNASEASAATQTAFEALTYLEVGEIRNVGEFGKEYQDIQTNTINQRQTKHHKGSYDQGELPLDVYFDPDDTGQQELFTALDSDLEWAFKVTLNDASGATGSTPTTYYFRGKVFSGRRILNDVNQMVGARFTVRINTDPVEVAAT